MKKSKKGEYDEKVFLEHISDIENKGRDIPWHPEKVRSERRKAMVGWDVDKTEIFGRKGSFEFSSNEVFISKTKKFLVSIQDKDRDIILSYAKKLDTLLKLRYIDNSICNNPDKDHDDVIEGLRKSFIGTLKDIGSYRVKEGNKSFEIPTLFDPSTM